MKITEYDFRVVVDQPSWYRPINPAATIEVALKIWNTIMTTDPADCARIEQKVNGQWVEVTHVN